MEFFGGVWLYWILAFQVFLFEKKCKFLFKNLVITYLWVANYSEKTKNNSFMPFKLYNKIIYKWENSSHVQKKFILF